MICPLPSSGIPPDDLLDLIYHYKALLIRQLYLWYRGQEAIVDHLLHRFVLARRIFRNSERVACNADWLSNGNPAYEMAFWALLDFRDSVEYQLPGNHGITISAFTENGEYDFVSVLPGHEKSTSDVVQAQREALGQRLVIVVQNPDQIPLITIRPVAAYCVVSPDGKTTYYTTAKEAAPCQPPTSAS